MARARHGFSLIELIIVLAIFSLSAAIMLPYLGQFQEHATAQTVSQDIARVLRMAQHKAMAGEEGQSWGVAFAQGSYVLYAGPSYPNRQAARDRPFRIPKTFTLQGGSDVNFALGSGAPSFGSGMVMILPKDAPPTRILINAAGGIFPEPHA